MPKPNLSLSRSRRLSRSLRLPLQSEGYPVATMDFPHDSAMHGKLIREILSGAKGGIKQASHGK